MKDQWKTGLEMQLLMVHTPDGDWLLTVFLGESVDWGKAIGWSLGSW